VRRACAAAGNNYRMQPYPERILLFSASDKGLRGLDNSSGGWLKYALGGLELHEIDGDHGNILNEPNVRLLAADLRKCLDRAQKNRSEAEKPLEQPDLQLK